MFLQSSPWQHESELAMVRDWFFPEHVKQDVYSPASGLPSDMRQRAVNRVNMWLFKAGRLPPALIATAGLTEALLHEEKVRAGGGGISESAMQSIFAMAFARFVNGFVDRDVARSHAAEMAVDDGTDVDNGSMSTAKGENSMYAHAATIRMPQTFVDLRHEVTHGHIPNLTYLKRMTLNALQWLWERWWMKNATGDPARALWELQERKRAARDARNASDFHTNMTGMVDQAYIASQAHDRMAIDELAGET